MKKDFKGLEILKKRLRDLTVDKDPFMAQTAKGAAAIFLREVKARTPVGKGTFEEAGVYKRGPKKGQPRLKRISQGGTLRRGWHAGHVERRGAFYITSVRNSVEYAPYVEYGHRQTPGRYVKALGKRLVKSWVDGKFMMTNSAPATDKARRDYVQARFKEYVERNMNRGK